METRPVASLEPLSDDVARKRRRQRSMALGLALGALVLLLYFVTIAKKTQLI